MLAHAIQVLCLGAAVLALWRLALRLVGGPAAAVAPVLFATFGFTKFVTGWASGFQDLLALTLMLGAVVMHAEGRRRWAVIFAALAPFAKETGFLATPLVVAWGFLIDGERRPRAWMLAHAAIVAIAAAIHIAARLTWTSGGNAAQHTFSPTSLANRIGEVLGGFVAGSIRTDLGALAPAVVAAVAVWLLMRSTTRSTRGVPGERVGAFLAVASLMGLGPYVVGNFSSLTTPLAYHVLPAIPWIALAVARLGSKIPAAVLKPATAGLAALNVAALAFTAPARQDPEFWRFRSWDWAEAVRLSEVSKDVTGQIRDVFRFRPESLVVLFGKLPMDSYLQTEDGPATRIALGDPTVRSYWLNDVPGLVAPGRFTIATFDEDSSRLRIETPNLVTSVQRAATSLMLDRPRTAYAWASFVDSTWRSRYEIVNARAASLLMVDGVKAYARELAAAGYLDSTGSFPERFSREAAPDDPGLAHAYETLLRRPLTAAAHAVLGDSLRARGAQVDAGVCYRVASRLDPGRVEDRLRLARLLMAQGERDAAREELSAVTARTDLPALAEEARAELARLEGAAP